VCNERKQCNVIFLQLESHYVLLSVIGSLDVPSHLQQRHKLQSQCPSIIRCLQNGFQSETKWVTTGAIDNEGSGFAFDEYLEKHSQTRSTPLRRLRS
jgi:hypothetical protein